MSYVEGEDELIYLSGGSRRLIERKTSWLEHIPTEQRRSSINYTAQEHLSTACAVCEIEPRYSRTALAITERRAAVSHRRVNTEPRPSLGTRRAGQASEVATTLFSSELESFPAGFRVRSLQQHHPRLLVTKSTRDSTVHPTTAGVRKKGSAITIEASSGV